jgi:hypothetical protein
MPRPKQLTLGTLRKLALLRMQNNSWATCAKQLRRSVATLEKMPEEYPEQWQEYKQAALKELQEMCLAEAVSVLREQLRDGDIKERRAGAKNLAGILGRAWPGQTPGEEMPSNPQHSDLAEYAARLTRMTDDDFANEADAISALETGATSPARPAEYQQLPGMGT